MVAPRVNPLIVILGETASGKSDLALSIAYEFNGEIINADSWSVYKGFDIGTAKPSVSEQKKVRHHLIDVAEPLDGFSAAIFKRLAIDIIEDINNRSKLPIMVGGSGLYIDSILYDYSFLPASPKELRDTYNNLSLNELKKIVSDNNYDLSDVDTNNKRRLIRLIENDGVKPTANEIRPNTLILGMQVEPEILKSRIVNRVDQMFSSGLENEVRTLYMKFGWDIEPMKGIGYREFREYFDGSKTLDEVRELVIKDSIKLAKKQRTWFKRNNSIQWITNSSNIVYILTTFLNK